LIEINNVAPLGAWRADASNPAAFSISMKVPRYMKVPH